ncbi:MAG TPA: MATE family efflux transporter [Xanthobacteraceae bacterium]
MTLQTLSEVAPTPAAAKPPPEPAGARAEDRTDDPRRLAQQAMLHGPVLATILRFAWPTVLVIVAQVMVGVAETFYVSYLGTAALAGVALVFPLLMLMTMMSNGGIGGGVSSAVARAIGARRADDADALVLHGLTIAVLLGLGFMAATLLLGPAIYARLGGTGEVLDAALTYSGFVFIGAVPSWIVSQMAAALRGAGNVKVPALVTLASAAVLIGLSPALIFGFGPIPGLGIAGAGIAVSAFNLVAAVVLVRYVASGRALVVLKRARLEKRLFGDILRVGFPSALGTVLFNLTVLLVTGAVGLFGTDALAGYGIASRLDYLLIPLLFGLGTSVVTMVGTNIGAGAFARARRIAWTGALLAACVTELIGCFVAVWPSAWLGLFTNEPTVLATGAPYLRIVGPFYGATGLGMLLYFASQGAGRVVWPIIAGTARLIITALFGWMAVARFGLGQGGLFGLVAVAAVTFGAINAIAMLLGAWGRPQPAPSAGATAQGR